jgi:hypothetical protein
MAGKRTGPALYPTVDESRDRLNRLLATGNSQSEAWHRATVQAREMGLLAAPRE